MIDTVALKLEKLKNVEITIVDDKEHFEATPGNMCLKFITFYLAVLRCLADPTFINQVQVKHVEYLSRSKFVLGQVSVVEEGKVTLKDGLVLDFDYLVIGNF
jgi:hypothetical protein